MSLITVFAVSLLAAASSPANVDANNVQPVAFTNNASTLVAASPAGNTDKPSMSSGGHAPDFQYQSYDALWQHLHNVLEHGDVLLVFGASDVDLRTLERERETLVKQRRHATRSGGATTTATCGPRSAVSGSRTACSPIRRARSVRSTVYSTPVSVAHAARGS